ncbi:MAG: leucine--tRNA ligase [Endomicrobium sp.]|jgi:leucyl-tRNA synthetase|nr:leucine--tRNA ligase [Endomicrobium sp.]
MVYYDHSKIEKKWQGKWTASRLFESKEDSKKEKYYCLEMLPYPSGNLHMGHVRNYTIGDVLARFHRMKGENVLYTAGWDAFGLPAENAAIKNKVHPAEWTKKNIQRMKKQLKSLGFSYDWERETTTCDPQYYKWTQWLFIKMWKKGLVFRKSADVNWCPSCRTVLANEQVSNGICWRCESRTEHKNLEQWFIKITDYADELLKGHDELGGWPPQVLSMQRNWIGKSYGTEIDFKIADADKILKIFTTRPDTIFGVTFMVVAPEHKIINELKSKIINYKQVAEYVLASNKKSNIERSSTRNKTGIRLEGINALNPATGKIIPVFTADYVLTSYGTGAVMAVPAHDQRDWEFAEKFDIPVVEVIKSSHSNLKEHAYEHDGVLVNSGQFNGIKSSEAFSSILNWIEKQGFGRRTVNFKLKDWLISRQRYWGTPIPMIYCRHCGVVPVPEQDLPVVLPEDVEFKGSGESPLKTSKTFVNVKCPRCGGYAVRETDTMDTFVDSSWYYTRYCDAHSVDAPFSRDRVNYWMPVNQYIGGIEHACMHLIYARFWFKVMRDLGLVKYSEPFTNLLTQGMVTLGGVAMSKSKGNIVSPDEMLPKYGADTVRLFILFAAPPQKQLDWSSDGIEGCWKFINRVWRLFDVVNTKSAVSASKQDKDNILKAMHKAIKKVTLDIEKFQFNTAVSSIMELVNELYSYKYHANDDNVSLKVYEALILLLAPFTPHLCEEIWEKLRNTDFISVHSWPKFDDNIVKDYFVEIPVQINGRVRDRITIPVDACEDEVRKIISSNEKILKYLKDKQMLKFIYIKDKIVTIVLK